MPVLDQSTGMEYGQDYVFSFKLSAYLATVNLADIQGVLNQYQDLQGVSVQESQTGAAGLTLTGGLWDVSFTFAGDDTVATVGSVAQEISNAVASTHYLVSFNLVQAATADTGGLVGSGAADKGLNTATDLADKISKDFLYLGIGVIVLIFAVKFL